MNDLIIAWVILAIEAIVCFMIAQRVCRDWSARAISFSSALCVAMLFGYGFGLRGWVGFVLIMPFSNVVVLSNLAPAILGLLAGTAVRHQRISRWKKGVSLVVFIAIAIYAAIQPVIRTVPETSDLWYNDVCMQTSNASCSACCGATLLRDVGIQATETEMVDLCLTNSKGTTMLGLYRGLKIKTRDTDQTVHAIIGDVDMLRANTHWPIAMSVGLPQNAIADPIYEREFGWIRGERHAVVMYGFVEDDRLHVGDPSVGHEQWTVQDLELLFRGSALYLSEK